MTDTLTSPSARHSARRASAPDFRALVVAYTARSGRRRKAVLGVDSTGEWALYDVPAAGRVRTGKVVQALPDQSDGVRQAIALQADYADTQAAYRDGRREYDPLPKFTRRAVSRIVEHAERAVALALAQATAANEMQLTEQLLVLAGEPSPPDASNGSSQTKRRSP